MGVTAMGAPSVVAYRGGLVHCPGGVGEVALLADAVVLVSDVEPDVGDAAAEGNVLARRCTYLPTPGLNLGVEC